MSYQNAQGSTGYLKGSTFVAFESQEEADKSLEPAEKPEPKKTTKKAEPKEE